MPWEMPGGSLEREPETTLPARKPGEEGEEGGAALWFRVGFLDSGLYCELCVLFPSVAAPPLFSFAIRSERR